ncbi:MAG: hypothetical protein V4622_05875 [Bacteroidota bacterium]
MKKVTYIVLGLSLVAVFSCQKENIKPNASLDSAQGVEWTTTDSNSDNEKSLGSGNTSGTDTGTATSGSGLGTEGDITDPNNDPDKIKKKGK